MVVEAGGGRGGVSIGRDDLTSDGQLAFWYTRYMLREAGAQQEGGGQLPLDIPVFLRAHAETILTTGAGEGAGMRVRGGGPFQFEPSFGLPVPVGR